MTSGIIVLLIGAVLTHVGWRHWRYRKQPTISLLEAGLLKAMDEAPLPGTSLDKFLTYVSAGLGLILGPFFLFCGIAVLAGELGYL